MAIDVAAAEPWEDASSPALLAEHLAQQRPARAELLVEALIEDLTSTGRRLDDETARSVLATLKRAAWFPRLRRLGDAIVGGGQESHNVIVLLAQAEIEHGELPRAIERLYGLETALLDAVDDDTIDLTDARRLALSEVTGLLGRAYKQLYIDARPTPIEPRRYDLERALSYYERGHARGVGDVMWLGINIVALQTHALRIERADPRAFHDGARELAGEILAELDRLAGEWRYWNWATKAEAHLARGEFSEAIDAVQRCLSAPEIDAFGIQSTLRQFDQLWMLDDAAPPGDTILPLLRASLAEQSGQLSGDDASVTLRPEHRATYEKVLGDTGFQPVRWLRDALVRATGVVLLGPEPYAGEGTGFVIEGEWLGPDYAGRPLVLTNAHVCTNDPITRRQFPGSFRSSELIATFLGLESGPVAVPLAGEVVWSSQPRDLDATIVELAGPLPEGASAPELCEAPMAIGDRAYVIGYPGGRATPQVSLQDNEVRQIEETPFVRYRTPTEGGSSGSPVFDERWRLAALHHAFSSRHQLNEGLMIDELLAKARAELDGSS